MNITHIVSSLDSNQGGPPQVVFNLAESQSLEGHKVNILSQYKRINYKKKTKFKRFKIIRGSFLIKKHYIPDFDFIKKIYNNIKNCHDKFKDSQH